MKTQLLSALVLTFTLTAHADPGLSKLAGVYESEGHRFEVLPYNGSLALRTDADLSKNPRCATHVGAPVGQRSSNGFAEVYYQLAKGNCPGIDGQVTLHYNRTIFGSDVFLIDVVVQRNTMPTNPHGITNGRTVRWSLTKVSAQ